MQNKLSVKDLSKLSGSKKGLKNTSKKHKDSDVLIVEREMSEAFGHKVEIEARNKKSGKLNIFYKSSDELETIISKLKN